jgi:hypothetical protein
MTGRRLTPESYDFMTAGLRRGDKEGIEKKPSCRLHHLSSTANIRVTPLSHSSHSSHLSHDGIAMSADAKRLHGTDWAHEQKFPLKKNSKSPLHSRHNEPSLHAKMSSSKIQNTPFHLRLSAADALRFRRAAAALDPTPADFASRAVSEKLNTWAPDAVPQSKVRKASAFVVRNSVVPLAATHEFQPA